MRGFPLVLRSVAAVGQVIMTYLSVLDLRFAKAEFPVDEASSEQEVVEHTRHTSVFRLQAIAGPHMSP